MADGVSPLSTTRVSGYDFGAPVPQGGWIGTGQDFGWTTHQGSDIGTPAGQPIKAPFAGVASFQTGLTGYGNLLTEKLPSGWSWLFGHVASGVSGPVAEGQQIGVTGANVGSAQGAVTLVELLNPQGQPVNPDPTLAALAANQPSSSGFTFPNPLQPIGDVAGAIAGLPAGVATGAAGFFGTAASDIGAWLQKQAVAAFVAVIVLIVLFMH